MPRPIFKAGAPANFHYFTARGAEDFFNLDVADINLLGEVGYEITDAGVIAALAGRGDVVININSYGGNYYQGLAIYNALKNHPGKVTMRVLGIAASAASLIFMGASVREVAPTAQLMIHNASVYAAGNKEYLQKVLTNLAEIDAQMVKVYSEVTGLTPEKIAEMMTSESYLNSESAVEMGFATGVITDKNTEDAPPAPLDLSAVLSFANELKTLI